MAARVAPGDAQQLHHFVDSSPWATEPLERVPAQTAERLVGGPDAVLIIDDTALPKQGRHSVGVARRCCGALGKTANYQTLVSLTLAAGRSRCRSRCGCTCPRSGPRTGRAATAPGCRPSSASASDRAHRTRSGAERRRHRRDSAGRYGLRDECRVSPDARGARPPLGGRCAAHPEGPPGSGERRAAHRGLRRCARPGRRRTADGPGPAPAREHVWLVCERRMGGERKYHLTNQPTTTPLLTLVRTIKARWVGEQAHGNALCRWPFARTRSRPGPSRTPRSSS